MNYKLRIKKILRNIVVFIITLEARAVLWRYRPKIAAITGSVGKTSTKDAVFLILNSFFRTRKSEKSFNSEIGLPLTIIGLRNAWDNPLLWLSNIFRGLFCILWCPDYPEWLVLEIGADAPGDIEKISSWLGTNVVVMTRIAEIPVHIEKYRNQKEVVREKAHLIKTLVHGGTLVLNADDPSLESLKEKTKNITVKFGFSESSDIRASGYHISYDSESDNIPKGISFKVAYGGSEFPVKMTGVVGRQNVYVALAAFAVGVSQKLNFIKMIEKLSEHESPSGRFKMLPGIKGSVILDDTYNSSPVALEMAVASLSEMKSGGRKMAVLGDMLELGPHSEGAHKKIGQMLPSVCEELILVGEYAKYFEEGALSAGMKKESIRRFDNSSDAAKFVRDLVSAGDLVLIKGSQGMRMERVVAELVPKDIGHKLVRQEKEWSKR